MAKVYLTIFEYIGVNFVMKVGAHGECRVPAYSRGLGAEQLVRRSGGETA